MLIFKSLKEKMQLIQAVNEDSSEAEVKRGLLDVLVLVAENLKLLVIGPLVVGLSALGICFMVPQTYQSVAVFQADQTMASLMTTASVLDPVVTALKLQQDTTLEEARAKLQRQIKTSVGRVDKLLTLTVAAETAAQAQAVSAAVLQQTFVESRPKGTVRMRLETQLVEAQLRLRNAQEVAQSLRNRLESVGALAGGANSEMARGYAELLGASGAAQSQIGTLESQLEGLSDAHRIQAPTLPERPSQPKKALIAIGATFAAGLALLLFVFIRRSLRAAALSQIHAEKLVRLRKILRSG